MRAPFIALKMDPAQLSNRSDATKGAVVQVNRKALQCEVGSHRLPTISGSNHCETFLLRHVFLLNLQSLITLAVVSAKMQCAPLQKVHCLNSDLSPHMPRAHRPASSFGLVRTHYSLNAGRQEFLS